MAIHATVEAVGIILRQRIDELEQAADKIVRRDPDPIGQITRRFDHETLFVETVGNDVEKSVRGFVWSQKHLADGHAAGTIRGPGRKRRRRREDDVRELEPQVLELTRQNGERQLRDDEFRNTELDQRTRNQSVPIAEYRPNAPTGSQLQPLTG